jgi:hypothetical protein
LPRNGKAAKKDLSGGYSVGPSATIPLLVTLGSTLLLVFLWRRLNGI